MTFGPEPISMTLLDKEQKLNEINKKEKTTLKKVLFRKFFTCPGCGRAIVGDMDDYFTCPKCGKALCKKSELENFKDAYCGNCGYEITSAKETALALVTEEN